MDIRRFSAIVASFVIAVLASGASAADGAVDVVKVARSFADGGGYRWEGGSGAPCEITVDGVSILAAQKEGTYCSGFTYAVVMRSAESRRLLAGKTADELRLFQKQWYGSTDESAERQCALAVEELGVGREVKRLEDAELGDCVQLWRTNKSGHSVVLLELARDVGGKVIGLTYRSSQKSTDGIGDRSEYLADARGREGKLDRRRVYVARLNATPR